MADGEPLSGRWLDEFYTAYTPKQAARIDKIVRIQGFANFFMSTIKNLRQGKNQETGASCALPPRDPDSQ